MLQIQITPFLLRATKVVSLAGLHHISIHVITSLVANRVECFTVVKVTLKWTRNAGTIVLLWTKKKTHFRDSRWEERCSICSMTHDQRRAKVVDWVADDLALRWLLVITRSNSILLTANLGDGSFFFVQGSSTCVHWYAGYPSSSKPRFSKWVDHDEFSTMCFLDTLKLTSGHKLSHDRSA